MAEPLRVGMRVKVLGRRTEGYSPSFYGEVRGMVPKKFLQAAQALVRFDDDIEDIIEVNMLRATDTPKGGPRGDAA